ncbi:MAG: heparan-alpha-glucosaminide N-acetyltransferase domain-containing protein, partial [Chitinophagaceae bacterium]
MKIKVPEMTILANVTSQAENFNLISIKSNRITSIDILRGVVMILMALDHVRNYFHKSAFLFDPTDLSQTSVVIFFTRWITHYCAPVFVLLAGISANLNGARTSRKELSFFLFTRGLWLVFAEMFIVTLEWTFNPTYPIFNLQVIWAIGVGMMVLSGLIYMSTRYILLTGILLIVTHNLLDGVHVPGTGVPSILWAMLHEPKDFIVGNFTLFIHYPVLPWIGIMAVGYCLGNLYLPGNDPKKRKR